MFCFYLSLLLFHVVGVHSLDDVAGWPLYLGSNTVTSKLVKRADPDLTLCTGANYSGTCTNFTLNPGECQPVNIPYSSNLWSSRTAQGYICFLFRNPTCSGCEVCVDPEGYANMSTFAHVFSMQCKVPDALACSNALCTNHGTALATPGTVTVTASQTLSTSTAPLSSNPSSIASSTTSSTVPPPTETESKSNTATIAGSVVGAFVGLLILTSAFVYMLRRLHTLEKERPGPEPRPQEHPNYMSNYMLEPFVDTSPTHPSISSSKRANFNNETPTSPYPISIIGSSRGPPSSISSPTSQRSELEERIRSLEGRLVALDTTSRGRKAVPSSPVNTSPRMPTAETITQEQIQNLRSEIEGLRRQQRSMFQQFDTPPAYQ